MLLFFCAGAVVRRRATYQPDALGYPVLPEQEREEVKKLKREELEDRLSVARLIDNVADTEEEEINLILFALDHLQ